MRPRRNEAAVQRGNLVHRLDGSTVAWPGARSSLSWRGPSIWSVGTFDWPCRTLRTGPSTCSGKVGGGGWALGMAGQVGARGRAAALRSPAAPPGSPQD